MDYSSPAVIDCCSSPLETRPSEISLICSVMSTGVIITLVLFRRPQHRDFMVAASRSYLEGTAQLLKTTAPIPKRVLYFCTVSFFYPSGTQ